ncbi:MAG: hypothetical protein Q9183_003331, partial [Haloplaca sp. 2 TL-2023]
AEIDRKDHRLRVPSQAIQYVGFAGKNGGGLRSGNTTGAYLSARYESRREETDFTVLDYLQGHLELNPSAAESQDVGNHDDLQRVIKNLDLEALVGMPVSNLSNGQTRRARIAKALLGQPEVLLLDEPFMGLDPPTLKSLSPLLHSLAEAQAPRIIMSLRPQDPLPEWITHVIRLGPEFRVTFQGPRHETLPSMRETTPSKSQAEPGVVRKKGSEEEQQRRYQAQPSREGLSMRATVPETLGEPVVDMHSVQVKYGDKVVLGNWTQVDDEGKATNGLSWTVRRGSRWGVFGPNGSGKTTLLSLICSDHPQSYSLPITLFGQSRLPRRGMPGISIFDLQSRIGHSSPEIHSFFPKHLSLRRCLESAWSDTFLSPPQLNYDIDNKIDTCLRWFEPDLNPAWISPKMPRRMSEWKQMAEPKRRIVGHAGKVIHMDASTDWADALLFSSLPFSAQRLALFLRAVVKKPDLVVLDEAFSGMDAPLRDKCLLFLTWGNTRIFFKTKRDTLRVKHTPEVILEEQSLVEGLEKDQALIVVSHVKEEVPGVVRDWLCLPEAQGGGPVRFGSWKRPLEGVPRGWEKVWNGEIVNLLSTDDEAPTTRKEKSWTTQQAHGDSGYGSPPDNPFDIDDEPRKRRRLTSPVQDSEDGFSQAIARVSAEAGNPLPKTNETNNILLVDDDDDPIVWTSSPKYKPTAPHSRPYITEQQWTNLSDSDESLPDEQELRTAQQESAVGQRKRVRKFTVSEIYDGKEKRRTRDSAGNEKKRPPARAKRRSKAIAAKDSGDGTDESGDGKKATAKKFRKPKLDDEQKAARARATEEAKALAKAARAKEKEEAKERRRLLKEEQAREKQKEKDRAEVNKSKLDKKLSTPEMIVDLPIAIDGSTVDTQIRESLKNIGVETTSYQCPVPNLIRWRRKIEARVNPQTGYREKLSSKEIDTEKHTMCLVSAKEFVELAKAGNESLDEHVTKIRSAFKDCIPIYLIEGLDVWVRKNRNARNRNYQAAVLGQAGPQSHHDPATAPNAAAKRAKQRPEVLDEDMIDDALLRLQISNKCLIHHTAASVETAEWVAYFTEQISQIPYRHEQMARDAAFCMDAGQVKCGKDAEETYINMFLANVRVTAPVAYGIADKYPNVGKLVQGLEAKGPLALENLKV